MKSQKNKIRVMIADDHAILRSGLRMLLAAQEDIQVVGEAEDGTQTLEAVRATKPNVLLLDMSMPDSAGAEIIGQVRKQSPKTRVLILTMHTEPEYLHSALGAGASGYVLKRALDSDLIAAIRVTYKGETFVDSRMNRFLVERSLSSPQRFAARIEIRSAYKPRTAGVEVGRCRFHQPADCLAHPY